MNRINQLFEKKKKGILSLYFCAGHPTLEGTVEVIKTLASNGIDISNFRATAVYQNYFNSDKRKQNNISHNRVF